VCAKSESERRLPSEHSRSNCAALDMMSLIGQARQKPLFPSRPSFFLAFPTKKKHELAPDSLHPVSPPPGCCGNPSDLHESLLSHTYWDACSARTTLFGYSPCYRKVERRNGPGRTIEYGRSGWIQAPCVPPFSTCVVCAKKSR
jgi:hypothetical protein